MERQTKITGKYCDRKSRYFSLSTLTTPLTVIMYNSPAPRANSEYFLQPTQLKGYTIVKLNFIILL